MKRDAKPLFTTFYKKFSLKRTVFVRAGLLIGRLKGQETRHKGGFLCLMAGSYYAYPFCVHSFNEMFHLFKRVE
ncbi:hypothetical protein SY85_17515 [Flavisolibacter tropicus]|uniref:Uncharacterized protein n=1 Tax=Flavisolibacter tropicus TaxID=1492898 RepID=A0A172TZ51_9BACT|nr:hypothetical protein SY85_17515 [Flavisolibacter tropicus]